MNVPIRDHGFYWVSYKSHPDYPECKAIAEWCYLSGVGRHVWFLPGDEDYRYDTEVTVISNRLSEPGEHILSKMRDFLGWRGRTRESVCR